MKIHPIEVDVDVEEYFLIKLEFYVAVENCKINLLILKQIFARNPLNLVTFS